MISQRQLEANQQNAQNSTGPRSAQGKAKSSMNALRHGLRARDVVIPGERCADFAAFQERMVQALAPRDDLERALAERIASAAWRLRRVDRYEKLLLEADVCDRRAERGEDWAKGRSYILCTLGYSLWNWLDRDHHDKLIRYESHLDGVMSSLLNELRRLRRRRHRRAVPEATSAEASVCADEAQCADEA